MHEKLRSHIEDLAAALILADTGDPATVVELRSRLARLRTALGEDGAASSCSAIDELDRVAHDLEEEGSDLSKALATLQAVVDRLQKEVEASATSPSPEWADAALLQELAASQRASLDELEAELLALEGGSLEAIASIRRRVHTLKGEAGVVGLAGLADVYHAFEDLLAAPDAGATCTGVLLKVRDWLEAAVSTYARGQIPEPAAEDMVSLMRDARVPSDPEAATATPDRAQSAAPADAGATAVARDRDTVALYSDFLLEAEDGLAKVDQILIDAETKSPDTETVNVLFRVFHSIKGVSSFLGCHDVTELAHATENVLGQARKGFVNLKGGTLDLLFNATEAMRTLLACVRDAVEHGEAIERQEDALALLLEGLREAAAGQPMPAEPVPQALPGDKLGAILERPPVNVPPEKVQQALERQRASGRRLGEELLAQGDVGAKDVAHALRAQAGGQADGQPGLAPKIQETIKVDVSRLDQLVEVIGELVVVESMVVNAPEISGLTSPRIRNYLAQLHKITRDAQDIGMRMRMVPVRGVFQKMARVARDLSHKSGKPVHVELVGESAEMDRSMVQQIADPLVHMIRNAIDHGLESEDERRKAGKDVTGKLRLSAVHQGNTIVIELSDDGKGLDTQAILRKAVAQGLVRENENPAESEIHQLIFLPGFSTARQVTEISGRGVGMDVVKRSVETLRGRVAIESRPGQGTTFRLLLPLTLAIIDGMLVRAGHERYILPTLSIVESVKPDARMLVTFAQKGECVQVRGETFPLLRLARLFQIDAALKDPTRGLVVLLEALGRRVGLLVDEVVSQQKVVIKPLGTGMQRVPFVSGAAILSDGTVGLILNVEQLVRMEDRGQTWANAAA